MKIKFDLILIPKAMLIIFILIGLGLMVLLYQTAVTSILAWLALSLITAFLIWIYISLFTASGLGGIPISLTDYSYHIEYSIQGLELVSKNTRKLIAWDNIESILHNDRPHIEDRFSARYTFFLKDGHKEYLDDESTANFLTLKETIPQYLKTNIAIPDTKRGTLLREEVIQTSDKKQITQTWKPQDMRYPSILVYDYQNRSIEQIMTKHSQTPD